MKHIIVFLLASILASCTAKNPAGEAGTQTILSFAKDMQSTTSWQLRKVGGSYPTSEQIRKLSVGFLSNEKIDVNEARIQIITGIQKFLKKINQEEKIRQFLIKHPFSSQDIGFDHSYLSSNGEEFGQNYIAYTFLQDGKIYYSTYNPKTDQLQTIHRETFEEAVRLVQAGNSSEPLPKAI